MIETTIENNVFFSSFLPESGTVSSGTINSCNVGTFGNQLSTWWPTYTYYPCCHKRPLEQAFAVASLLFSEGIVKEMSIGEFIALVDKLQQAL